MRSGIVVGVLLAACAKGGEMQAMPDSSTPMPIIDARTGGTGGRTCPAGELVTAVDASGNVGCDSPVPVVQSSISAGCSVYLGWRDNCDGCTTAPAKWGRAGATCTNTGTDTTCVTYALGGADVPMFGLNPDGDLDGNDKLYGSLYCKPEAAAVGASPCPPGQFVTGVSGSNWTCASLSTVALDYVRDNCSLYLGWRDDCDGCTTVPIKWGRSGSTASSCMNGAGADNTCSLATLGSESVNLFGLSPDGDVDGNDKLYIGLDCLPPTPLTTTATETCPAGQFVTGTATDGSFKCESPAQALHDYFTQQCSVYYGWRDDCNGCLVTPSKWGSVKVGSCTLGIGADNTCGSFNLGRMVDTFGLNPDGDVDGNDMLYVGLHCE